MSEVVAEGSAPPKEYFEDVFWTPVIHRFAQLIAERIANDLRGCGIWGLQLIGKTHFGAFLEKTLPDMFGGTLIVVNFNFLGRSFTKPEALQKRCLVGLGVRAITGREHEALCLKTLSAIRERYRPETRRVVIIWDEIQNIKEDLWGEIMYIEEAIRSDGRKPYTLCIGQPEIQNTVDLVEREGRFQSIGRMFQTRDEFRGLTLPEVGEFLVNLDGADHAFTRKHFPARAEAGWTIQRLIEPITDAVESLANWDSLNRMLLLPASTLRQTLNALFAYLDDKDNHDKQVSKQQVLEAFKDNGFKRLFMAYSCPRPAPMKGDQE